MRRKQFSISYFLCPKCDNVFPLPRPKSRMRELGHIKTLYCVFCNDMVKTIEIRSGDCYIKDDESIIFV